MELQPHQQRVVDEKAELDKKATDLSNFIGLNPIFKTLDAAEQERLRDQCEVMWQYSEILWARIAAFSQQSVDDKTDELSQLLHKLADRFHGSRLSLEACTYKTYWPLPWRVRLVVTKNELGDDYRIECFAINAEDAIRRLCAEVANLDKANASTTGA